MRYKNFNIYVCFVFIFVLSLTSANFFQNNNTQIETKAFSEQAEAHHEDSKDLFLRSKSIADVVEKVSDGIVTVSVNSIVNSYRRGVNKVNGIGTGFFISPTKILTNYHVVLNSSTVKIILNSGDEIEARVVNSDQVNDIALLEVVDENFRSPVILKMGATEETRVGDWVIAIGSPLDLSFSGSATIGIVSGLARTFETKYGMSTFIQTDAAINPGNSGGPLLNLNAEVIGINTAKIDIDGVESIGFAIPIEFATMKLDELNQQIVNFGIGGVDISNYNVKNLNVQEGIFVVEVERDSIAYNIGLVPGDIILNFNGNKVSSIEEINKLKSEIGDEISFDVMRNGKIKNLALRFNE